MASLCAGHLYGQPGGTLLKQQTEEESVEKFFTRGTCNFSKEVPTPFQVLGFNIGERYADWNDVLKYMEALERSTGKVAVQKFGKSYQQRDFIQVAISSCRNMARLEEIKREHIELTDADKSSDLNIETMPVVVDLMASIHGNEASGVNGAILLAYYLAAQQSEEFEKLLDNTVVLITPGLNPDGINRFASYVNTSASKNRVANLDSREFSENWPSSRSNHYWADCNRDWLAAQHPEGLNSMRMYLEWMPNVVLDMHEQGTTYKGFYFSPGDKNRTYKDTPKENQELTYKIAENTAHEFDKSGIAYYSKEGYDDYFVGKGAAYGDLLGSVAILHEQIASRGYLRPTGWGDLPFWESVRNQTIAAMSVVNSSYNLKNTLLSYQRDFYRKQKKAAAADAVKGYRFSARGDNGRICHFIENMMVHNIKVYRSKNSEDEYIIPLNQNKYYIIKAMWDVLTEFDDTTFYDISTWTFPYAYNLSFTKLGSLNDMGEEVKGNLFREGRMTGGRSNVAYLFDMGDYYAPYLLSELLKKGIRTRIASKSFTFNENGAEKKFNPGTVVIPVPYQNYTADELYALLESLSKKSGIDMTAIKSGFMQDFDLGSPAMKPVTEEPNVAVVVGKGMSVSESGEIWHLLDWRFNVNHTLVDWSKLTGNFALHKYNVIIFANGTPGTPLSAEFNANLAKWVENGGTLIVTGGAYSISNKCGLTKIQATKGAGIKGAILKTGISQKSPLFWGYDGKELPIFKMNANTYSCENAKSAAKYTEEPYISGYVSAKNLEKIAGSDAILVSAAGKGRVVFIADDLNFRSYWYGTSKILLNAILFRDLL